MIKPQEDTIIRAFFEQYGWAHLNQLDKDKIFYFITSHFIHRNSLKSWLEEQNIGNKQLLKEDEGWNQAIQSVIEYIEENHE